MEDIEISRWLFEGRLRKGKNVLNWLCYFAGEGCWGFPHLKIHSLKHIKRFMFIISFLYDCHVPFLSVFLNIFLYISLYVSKVSKMPVHGFPKSDNHLDSPIYETNMFVISFHMFLIFSKYVCTFQCINKGPPGVKNPEIMEMLGFVPSKNKTKILLDQH